jgi:hypothetical protein
MAGPRRRPGSSAAFEIQVALDRSHEQSVLARYRPAARVVVDGRPADLCLDRSSHRRRGVRPIAQITAIGRRITR